MPSLKKLSVIFALISLSVSSSNHAAPTCKQPSIDELAKSLAAAYEQRSWATLDAPQAI